MKNIKGMTALEKIHEELSHFLEDDPNKGKILGFTMACLEHHKIEIGEEVAELKRKIISSLSAYSWIKFDFNDVSSRPTEYDKYLICRKDGKVHWETWNGSGWAYNHNEIRYWAKINPPL